MLDADDQRRRARALFGYAGQLEAAAELYRPTMPAEASGLARAAAICRAHGRIHWNEYRRALRASRED